VTSRDPSHLTLHRVSHLVRLLTQMLVGVERKRTHSTPIESAPALPRLTLDPGAAQRRILKEVVSE
jgi:hypothetical protein